MTTVVAINIQNEAFEASEPTIADLNGDGNAEVIFTTFGYDIPCLSLVS